MKIDKRISYGIVASALVSALMLAVIYSGTGCGGGSDSSTTAATNLNATGFWEDPLNGAVAAGSMVQNAGNVSGGLLLPPAGNGQIIGTVDGYHMTFTMAWDSGSSESGSGDFAFVDTGVDKLIFTGTLPSVGAFTISWRGPSFDEHTPAGQTLAYTPPQPTW